MTSSSIPPRSPPPRRRIRVVGAALIDHGKILIVRRPPHDTGAGMWEFPGGKIEPGESPAQALVREIEEELGVQAGIEVDLGWIHHAYETVDIELNVMICHLRSGTITLYEHDAMEWVTPDGLVEHRLLAADRPFVQKIKEHLASAGR